MNEQTIPPRRRLDKGDFFWLVYLVFFLIEPLARHSARLWLESGVCIVIFLALYAAFMLYEQSWARLTLLALMFALGVAVYPINNGSTCFLIYAAALLPFTISSVPWIAACLLTESVLLAIEGYLLHVSPYSWFIGVLLIISVGGSNIFFAQKQRANCKLQRKQEEIEALAAVAERERIARDLHDVLGHTLSVIVLKAELAGRLVDLQLSGAASDSAPIPAPELSVRSERSGMDRPASGPAAELHATSGRDTLRRARAEIGDVERTARTALAEVREAIGGYRARGLAAEIDGARQTLASAGVTLSTEGDLHPAALSAAEESVLALALREAVTNIVRHAEATSCHLRMVVEDGRHRLSIQDNGRHGVAREGNGLRGMRERVESLGGQLSLSRDSGTHLVIELPRHPATA